jgi:hypothetical protein
MFNCLECHAHALVERRAPYVPTRCWRQTKLRIKARVRLLRCWPHTDATRGNGALALQLRPVDPGKHSHANLSALNMHFPRPVTGRDGECVTRGSRTRGNGEPSERCHISWAVRYRCMPTWSSCIAEQRSRSPQRAAAAPRSHYALTPLGRRHCPKRLCPLRQLGMPLETPLSGHRVPGRSRCV